MPACSAGSEDQRVDIYVVHGATTDVVPGGTPRYSRDGMSEKSQAFKGCGELVVCDGAGVDTAAKLVVKQDSLVLLEEHLMDDGYAVGQDDDRGCLSWVTSPDDDGAGSAGLAAASIKVVFHSSEYFSRVTGFMSAYFYPPHGDLVDTSAEMDEDAEEEGTRRADCFPATASVTEYKQMLCRPSLPLLERHYVARSLLSRGHLDYLVHCARDAAADETGKDVRIMFEILAGVLSVGAAGVYARVFGGGDPFCDVFFALMARLVGMRKGGSVGRRKGVRSPKKAKLEAAVRECLDALPAYLSDDAQVRGLVVAAAKSRFFDNEIVNVVKSSSSNASSASSSSSSDTPARRTAAAAAAAAASPPHIVHIKRGFVAHDNHLKEQLVRRTVNLAVASTAPPSQLLADHLTFAASVLDSIEQRGTQYDALYRLVHPEEGGLLLDLFVKGLSRVGPAEETGWNTAAVFDAMYLFFGKAAEARNELPMTALREVLVRMHADREQVSEENAATVFLKLLLFAAAEGFDACSMLYHLLGLHDPEGFTEERTNDVRINCVRDQFVDLFHEEYLGSLVAALSLHSATNQAPLPTVLRILTASLKLRRPAQRLHVLETAVSEGTEVLEELCASVAKGDVVLSKESTIELAKFASASLFVLRTLGHEAHAAAVQQRRHARAEREEGRRACTADGREAGGSTASTSTSSASSSASFTIEAPGARASSHAELPSARQPRCLRLASLSVAAANFEKFLCRTGLLSYLVHDTLGREVARGTKGIVYTCVVGLMGQVAADGSGAPADTADVSAVSSATGDVGLEAQAYGEDLVRPTFAILRSFLVANNCGGFFLAASPLQPHARPADTCLAHIVAETTKMWMREQSRPWLAHYAEPLPREEEEEEVTIEHTGEESAEVSASEQEALTDTTLSYVAEPCVGASSCEDGDDASYNVEAERRRRWRQRRICSLTEENLRLNSSILEMESSCGASLPSMSDASSVVESADSYCSATNDADSPSKPAQSKERSPSPAYHTRLLLATSKRAYYDLRGNGPMSPFTDYTLDSRAKGTLSSVSHAADSILSEDDCFALNHKLQLQEEARWGKRPAARAPLAESASESTPTAATLVLSKRNLSLLTSSLLVADAGAATPAAQPAADTEAEHARSPPVSFESLASDAMLDVGEDSTTLSKTNVCYIYILLSCGSKPHCDTPRLYRSPLTRCRQRSRLSRASDCPTRS